MLRSVVATKHSPLPFFCRERVLGCSLWWSADRGCGISLVYFCFTRQTIWRSNLGDALRSSPPYARNRPHRSYGLGAPMLIKIGHVEAIFRYPVKSMACERLEVANVGWHGLDGDRRLAFRRLDDRSGMPWLTASKLPGLLLFAPQRPRTRAEGDLPTHIRTPDGQEMVVFGEELAAEVGRQYGASVQMMHLRTGIFDEANISVIASDTVREIGRLAGRKLDVRQFRPNVVVRSLRSVLFRRTNGWAACSHSVRRTTLPPSPLRIAISAARW
jgi:hypothetical protein